MKSRAAQVVEALGLVVLHQLGRRDKVLDRDVARLRLMAWSRDSLQFHLGDFVFGHAPDYRRGLEAQR